MFDTNTAILNSSLHPKFFLYLSHIKGSNLFTQISRTMNEQKYKIVTCASFGNTGSGIVTDYLLEFPSIHNPGDYEFRFLQDYGGVSTLEDALLHNQHRMNTDIAIRDFIHYIEYQSGDLLAKHYEKFFKGAFKKISYEFINKLIDVEWPGYWEHHQIIAPKTKRLFMYKLYPRIRRLLGGNRKYIARYLPKSPMYFSNPEPEYFYQCVKEYMESLCESLDPQHKFDFIYFDQLLPPTNVNRYFNYCNNLKVVIVDRDPRDHYIDNYFYWREGWIPLDLDKYIALYRGIRKKLIFEPENSNILRIKFEDAIYHYDEFAEQVNAFLGLKKEDHLFPKRNFDPAISIKNTCLWKRYPVPQSVLEKIERESKQNNKY